jgi:hypothetical protein
MPRVASTLLLVGVAVGFVAWVVRPASSTPQPLDRAPVVVDAPTANTLATITTDADALRDRLDTAPPYHAPTRDPFAYGATRQPRRSTLVPTPARDATAAVPAPPSLVAILVNDTPHGAARQAVFSLGDDVAIRSVGDAVGRWHVEAIDVDRVTIVDASGRSLDVRLH